MQILPVSISSTFLYTPPNIVQSPTLGGTSGSMVLSASISSTLPDGFIQFVASNVNAVNAPTCRPISTPFTRTVAFWQTPRQRTK